MTWLDRPIVEFATHLLGKRQRKALKRGQQFEQLSAEERHRLRIALKKLRYATEFFEALYPKKHTKPYLAALKDLQDGLGHLNDVAVAQRLAASSANPTGAPMATACSAPPAWCWAGTPAASPTWSRQSCAPGRNSPGASRSGAEAKGPPLMMVVLVANTKGGCGKTTVATNLAAALASHGRRTALAMPTGSARAWNGPACAPARRRRSSHSTGRRT